MTQPEPGAATPTADLRSEPHGGLLRPVLFGVVAALVAADLLSKSWAHGVAPFPPGEYPVLGGWLSLQKVHNSGGVFGFFQGFTLPLTVIRAAAVGLIVWLVGRQPRGFSMGLLTLGLLLAGALGNLYDNLSSWLPWPGNGQVRDFVRVDLGPAPGFIPDWLWFFDPWPIFNLADSCITIGFVLLLTGLASIRVQRPDRGAPMQETA